MQNFHLCTHKRIHEKQQLQKCSANNYNNKKVRLTSARRVRAWTLYMDGAEADTTDDTVEWSVDTTALGFPLFYFIFVLEHYFKNYSNYSVETDTFVKCSLAIHVGNFHRKWNKSYTNWKSFCCLKHLV